MPINTLREVSAAVYNLDRCYAYGSVKINHPMKNKITDTTIFYAFNDLGIQSIIGDDGAALRLTTYFNS